MSVGNRGHANVGAGVTTTNYMEVKLSSSSASPQPDRPDPAPFMTMHTAIILLAAVIIGLIAGILTFLSGTLVPAAVLAGLSTSGLSIPVLRSLIG